MSTEGLGSILEASCAILTGVVIGFIFSWRMALVCVAIAPFGVLTGYMNAKKQSGLTGDSD